ncbi:hypothetical protein AAON49_00705 [Pseudotenacibaculum sp. MALMAid0570]|uniref:hypothetical protein n=1 Tax=Pseudotenacibaculum sp. MALMAid0570 TaxID=3143938 RepID=UPI0032DFFA4D
MIEDEVFIPIITFTGSEAAQYDLDQLIIDLNAEVEPTQAYDAIALSINGDVALKGGFGGSIAIVIVQKGANTGDYGVSVSGRGNVGVDASISGTITTFYATEPNPTLNTFSGFEYSADVSVPIQGPLGGTVGASVGVDYQLRSPVKVFWGGVVIFQSPIVEKITYYAYTFGISVGVKVPIPVTFKGSLTIADYLYRSDE